MKNKIFALSLASASIIAAGLPLCAQANDTDDFYFQQAQQRYFGAPQSARSFGMAGSSAVTATDSSSVNSNPAGIGMMAAAEASLGYGYDRLSGDEYPTERGVEQTTNLGMGAIALPIVPTSNGLPEFGNFGVSWNSSEGRWNDDSYNTETKRTQVSVAYGYGITSDLSLGYSLGWTRDKLQSNDVFNYPMSDGFRHTLGALYRINNELTFGQTLVAGYGSHHALYGPGIEGDSDTTEYGFDSAVRYQIAPKTGLAFGVDYRHLSSDGEVEESLPQNFVGGDENGNLFNIRLGAEHSYNDWFTIRAGYRYAGLNSYNYNRVELNELNGSANYNAFTLGAGFVIDVDATYVKSVMIDYGVEYRIVADGDWSHLVTLSVPFTLCQAA